MGGEAAQTCIVRTLHKFFISGYDTCIGPLHMGHPEHADVRMTRAHGSATPRKVCVVACDASTFCEINYADARLRHYLEGRSEDRAALALCIYLHRQRRSKAEVHKQV